ncbi:MAG: alpha/beta fold hydrolase [Clostridia bacterium]|nr:alpha/beta fold hydrolase [Clostridia bacterium]
MTLHVFGSEHAPVLLMLHPLAVRWDIYDRVIPILEKDYRLVIPAIPGFDEEDPKRDFPGIEETCEALSKALEAQGYTQVKCVYGCSMGGALATRLVACGLVKPECAVLDGAILPYTYPKPVTYLIGIKDYLTLEIGRHLSIRALKGMFDPDKYTEADLTYARDVMRSMSRKTIWRGFYSTNNYALPSPALSAGRMAYWWGEEEKKERKTDIAYAVRVFPEISFREIPGEGHAEGFTVHPEAFCERLVDFIENREDK